MKKIDLHIHTIGTFSDSPFEFSIEIFKRYVEEAHLDAVAVTNHDVFDAAQFAQIRSALGPKVFPGIEINVDKGHVLVIANASEVDDFAAKAKLVAQKVTKAGESISVEQLQEIFGDLHNYLVIPHTDKSPPIAGDTLVKLAPYSAAGEVDSPKKFVRAVNDEGKLAPVLFSDARMKVGLKELSTRQTYVDCGEVTLSALKTSLRDKGKVKLSEADGNNLFLALENGQQLSTGLNVVLGGRSTGKSVTLDKIYATHEGVHYIRQFSLVQADALDEKQFNSNIAKRRSTLVEDHLSGLKNVLEDVVMVDLSANSQSAEKYIETLRKFAHDTDLHDAFSKAALFNETDFPPEKTDPIKQLFGSVRHIIENGEFRTIIEKHVKLTSLMALACELLELLWATTLNQKKKVFVNELVRDVKKQLKFHTAAVPISEVDLYEICMDERRVQRFSAIVGLLRKETIIDKKNISSFTIETKQEPFAHATDAKTSIGKISASGLKFSLVEAFKKYEDPFPYLQELKQIESLPPTDFYKYFTKISYRILNKDGAEVSGGERSEFVLLQRIEDANSHEMLLIDEPESSFDNLFLRSNVNAVLKAISASMPVVVVTHNSTVGASVQPDYVLYTRKEIEDGKAVYRIYSGYPADKTLTSTDGKTISTHEVLMDSLEAGVTAYDSRRGMYEAVKS